METVNGERVRRVTPFFAVVAVLPLVIWAGYRGNVGDTYAYIDMFRELPSTISGIGGYIEGIGKDRGFYFSSALIKCFIGNREEWYLILLAAFQCFLVYKICI